MSIRWADAFPPYRRGMVAVMYKLLELDWMPEHFVIQLQNFE